MRIQATALSAASTFVPFESSMNSIPRTQATGRMRWRTPGMEESAAAIAPVSTPISRAAQAAASALRTLCSPPSDRRSASMIFSSAKYRAPSRKKAPSASPRRENQRTGQRTFSAISRTIGSSRLRTANSLSRRLRSNLLLRNM